MLTRLERLCPLLFVVAKFLCLFRLMSRLLVFSVISATIFEYKDVRFIFTTNSIVIDSGFFVCYLYLFTYKDFPKRFSYEKMFMSFNSNTTGATTFTSGAHVFTPGFCDVQDFYVLYCRSSFVFWSLHFVPVCYVRTFLMIVKKSCFLCKRINNKVTKKFDDTKWISRSCKMANRKKDKMPNNGI